MHFIGIRHHVPWYHHAPNLTRRKFEENSFRPREKENERGKEEGDGV
jgi:hypothetical protein